MRLTSFRRSAIAVAGLAAATLALSACSAPAAEEAPADGAESYKIGTSTHRTQPSTLLP